MDSTNVDIEAAYPPSPARALSRTIRSMVPTVEASPSNRRSSEETSAARECSSFWSDLTDIDSSPRRKHASVEATEATGEALVCADESRSDQTLHELGLLHPHSPIKTRWNFLLAVFVIVWTTYTPFRLAFPHDVSPEFYLTFEILCSTVFCIDIVLTFNTAVLDENGITVVNRNQIALHYLRFWFWIDLLSSFPFQLISNAVTGNTSNLLVFSLFRMLRVTKLGSLADNLGHWKFKGVLFIFLEIIFVAHTISCFWYYYGSTSTYKNPNTAAGFPNTWVYAFIPSSYGTYDKYVASIYWTLFTMLAVGYGDIHPVNSG